MNKENKKGFTLVELLGVIVVLAILALITIPIISNVINDVRIKALQSSAYGLIEASNLYYAQYGTNNNLRFDIKNNQINSTDTTNLLKYKGSVKEGTVILDKKGQVIVCITDGKNSASKNYNESKVTTVKGTTCNIRENSNIVYLDDEATITEYSISKLTEVANEFESRISILEEDNSDLKENDSSINQQITNLSTRLNETNASMISLNDVYPVGSIYITTTEDTVAKVQAKFGGTWVVFGSGRTLVGVDTNQTEFNTVEKEAGEKIHTLSISEMPTHQHYLHNNGYPLFLASKDSSVTGNSWGYIRTDGIGSYVEGNHMLNKWFYTSNTGNNQPHNNLQPYITVYMYKRTA